MKKLFNKRDKELTPEQHRERLGAAGVPVKSDYKRPSKFSAFSDHAQMLSNKASQKFTGPSSQMESAPAGAPGGPIPPPGGSSNPYANAGQALNYKSGGGGGGGGGASNPYASAASSYQPKNSAASSPYSSVSSGDKYGDSRSGANRYGDSSSAAAQARTSTASPYSAAQDAYASRFAGNELTRTQTSETTAAARNELFKDVKPAPAPTGTIPGRSSMGVRAGSAVASGEDELFAMPSELDTSAGPDGEQQQTQMDSEDEDVEAIKGQIRFTKQESVNSTRNALRMATEAEESGRNTLGMLGAQGERISNTEGSLALAESQNRVAEQQAAELKTLNRSIFIPHVSNPFNSKRKVLDAEARLRASHMQEQQGRESRRQVAYDSQQRVTRGLTAESETAQKYRGQKYAASSERSRYQFEADSEDEEMENEIDTNLDAISQATTRLNRLAISTNEEINRQNERLDKIADQTDTLDVNVHLNTSRLANIK